MALRYFGGAGLAYMKKYGVPLEIFAKIRAKASRHAKNNPLAIFRKELSAEEVMNDQVVWPGVMTRLMACPPTCGAAAAILVLRDFREASRRQGGGGDRRAGDDDGHVFDLRRRRHDEMVGYDMSLAAAKKVYEQAGVGPDDIEVVELHDCFAANELLTYEALGLCPEGGAEKFIEDGDNTYGGKFVTNPSGGLLSKGHPLGATGLAQCTELTWQLRGTAEATRSTAPRSPFSTTSASAAPASSRCTRGCKRVVAKKGGRLIAGAARVWGGNAQGGHMRQTCRTATT